MFNTLLLICLTFSSLSFAAHVLVSVSPHKFFVERIAGDTVTIDVMVPEGASSHTFEPTPRQMMRASHADLWFLLGEPFEARAVPALQSYNPKLKLVDMRKGVTPIEDHCCAAHAGGADPHIWLSVKEAKIQAKTVAEALIENYPENKEHYSRALDAFLIELESLDKEILSLTTQTKNRLIAVSHPAYAYFCRDYGFEQVSIEMEGKDPTPKQLTLLLQQLRSHQVKRIFIQKQYSNKGAALIAQQLGAKLVMLDPYSEQYFSAMRSIAKAFGE